MNPVDPSSTTAVLRQTFDAVSSGYDALRFFRLNAERLAAALELRGDERVLDVATGTGHLALSIARRLPRGRVTGIDFSSGMLEQARRKAALLGASNVDWLEMDMLKLDLPADSCDVVVCAFGLFFTEDMQAQLERMAAVAKPGGTLVISSFDEGYFSPLKELMAERLARYGAQTPAQTWRRIAHQTGCRELFASAGLVDVRVEEWDCGYQLAGADEWWDVVWNGGFRRWVSQLSAADQEQFKREHLAEVEALRQPAGIRLAAGVLATTGRKPRYTGDRPG